MQTLEDMFIREFKNNVNILGNKNIYDIPLPDVCKSWYVSKSEEFQVQGIEDEYYGQLNDMIVREIPKGTIAKRKVIDKVTRGFLKDAEGKYVYDDKYKPPSGSKIVMSPKNINLPYSRYVKDIEGFSYIDYVVESFGRLVYIYAIPKDYLYKVNQTALAISVKKMRNYNGMGLVTWENGQIFVHVVPYTPNSLTKYVGSKILKTGRTVDYNKEIHILTDFWQEKGVIPDIKLCALQSGENLCLRPVEIGYDYYDPIDVSPVGYREIYGSGDSDGEGESGGVGGNSGGDSGSSGDRRRGIDRR